MTSKIARNLSFLLLSAPLLVACDKGPTKPGAPAVAAAPKIAEPAAVAPAAVTGTTFGAGVKLADATPIGAILADPNAYKGKTVRVEGMVLDVCEKRGCWFDMAGEAPGQKLRFKVTDGDMVFPVDAKGKYAVAQGEISVRELTLEQTREQAEEEASEKGQKFDPASVTKPTSFVKLDGTGAVMRDKK